MAKKDIVKSKFNGLCAYTGKPLGEDWQIDHAYPRQRAYYFNPGFDVNGLDNLLPALRIVNHYKRGYSVEGFRAFMLKFHIRLKKLPKDPKTERSKRRKAYMFEVASAFDITTDKPFSGLFFFEKTINYQ